MALSPKLIVCLIMVVLAVGEYTPIKRDYGVQSPYFNQTSYGTVRWVQGDKTLLTVGSIWMQDDVKKRLRIDVGVRGEPYFQAEFYFFYNYTYEVSAGPNNTITCAYKPELNYTTEVSTYGEPNFGFLGRHIMMEYDNITADLYAGQALDSVGPLNCIFYCDSETCTKYYGLTVTGSANVYSYLEYWYGDNLTSTIPPDFWFDLPPECTATTTLPPETTTTAKAKGTATTTLPPETTTTAKANGPLKAVVLYGVVSLLL